ncbi:MAG TPA: hypothetical protein VNO14_18580 [Blastocatellia bacterium]|nr:hypothetical protein [Blastocatellia bacterium]
MNALTRISAIVLAIVVAGSSVFGQQPGYSSRKKAAGQQPDSRAVTAPVAVVSGASPEYLSGEASVKVKGNENPIIRLGLAQSGVALIEFPAADRFFALHPGNSDMVTIDDSPTKARDHFFVFRAGSGFIAPPSGSASRGPSASIIAQMRSGMVVTFLIYPVRELSEMAHRVVVIYNRDEVVTARRAAGLAVNLDEPDQGKAEIASLRIAEINASSVADRGKEMSDAVSRPGIGRGDSLNESLPESSQAAGGSKKDFDVEAEAQKALKAAVYSPSKIKNWSPPLHGITVAAASARDLRDNARLVVVAVRNTFSAPLRLVPGHPEIAVETRDEQGKTLLVEQVKKLHVESSTSNEAIPGGATVYYVIVYQRPILGARQRLRVAVSQVNAADEPVATELTASAR